MKDSDATDRHNESNDNPNVHCCRWDRLVRELREAAKGIIRGDIKRSQRHQRLLDRLKGKADKKGNEVENVEALKPIPTCRQITFHQNEFDPTFNLLSEPRYQTVPWLFYWGLVR
jgi:hypothetical protein